MLINVFFFILIAMLFQMWIVYKYHTDCMSKEIINIIVGAIIIWVISVLILTAIECLG